MWLAADIGRRTSPVIRAPWAVGAAVGLIHGLGFAGALATTPLPEDHRLLALLGFNSGIEIGQLLVITIVMALHQMAPERCRQAQPALAWISGSLAAAWVLERAWSAWG